MIPRKLTAKKNLTLSEDMILDDLDDTPLSFGKHEGETPNQIYLTDPDYLVYLYEDYKHSDKVCTYDLYQLCLSEQLEHTITELSGSLKFKV